MLKFSPQRNHDGYQVSIVDLFNPEFPFSKGSGFVRSRTVGPKVNIKENDDEYLLELAVPGRQKTDFKILLDQGNLTVSTEEQEAKAEEENYYYKKEFSLQQFKKVFTLPESADTEKISGQYLDGVLRIKVPKREDRKPRPPQSITVN